MRSHAHLAATYLKHFSRDPSKGRYSIVPVYNKKRKIPQDLPVKDIGIKKGIFSEEVEQFHRYFENKYDKFIDLMSFRFPSSVLEDRLIQGFMLIFNFILRKEENYEAIKRIYNQSPEIVEEYGNNPWLAPAILISDLFFDLISKRDYPVSIRGFPNDVLITSDNPVITHRLPFGTAYYLTIDRRHIFLLGYCDRDNYLPFMEYFINIYEIEPDEINRIIRWQAETFYVI